MSDLSEAFPGPFSERFVPSCTPDNSCFIASHIDHKQGYMRDTYLERPSVQMAPIAITASSCQSKNMKP